MSYGKLSDLAIELNNPQHSDTFVKLFRAAVRDGKIEAMDAPERFTVPKMYKRRGAAGSYQRQARDMIYRDTPAVTAWFKGTKEALANTPTRQRKAKPSLESVQSGEYDFAAAAAETRRKMQAKFEKGQKLGTSRAKAKKK